MVRSKAFGSFVRWEVAQNPLPKQNKTKKKPHQTSDIFFTRNDTWNIVPIATKKITNEPLTSGCGSSGIMVHGCMATEFEFRAVVEEDAIGVVKPWQKAVAVAATQRDSDSLMVTSYFFLLPSKQWCAFRSVRRIIIALN